MLSANTLLRDGRYRIGHAITSGRAGTLYTAEDQISKQHVAIVERFETDEGRTENLIKLRHEGLVSVVDNFRENEHDYEVTEPIAKTEAKPNSTAVNEIFGRLAPILQAIAALRAKFPSRKFVEICAENIFTTADGNLKLLFVESYGIISPKNPQESPYLPFERVWDDLDLISQRAFYREFDDETLELLESAPDARSDMYSLGAVFYELLTGRAPLSAFERSFEMLDGKTDPLTPIFSLNNTVSSTQSQFVMKLLAVKRENRFDSLEDILMNMPMTPNDINNNNRAQNDATDIDNLELLEIPIEPQRERAEAVINGNRSDTHVLDQVFELSTTEISPESAMHAEDLDSFVDQFYSKDELHDRIDAHLAAKKVVNESEVATTEAVVENKVFEPVVEKRPTFSPEPETPKQRGGFGKMIGIAVASILVVGVAGFGLLSFMSGETNSAQEQMPYQAPGASIVEPSQQPVTSNEPVTSTSTETPQNIDAQPETPTAPAKSRPQVAEAKPAKPAEAKPAKTEEKPKKKMTVDDLLN